ncbi:MAG: hypothetical protein GTN70_00395 [Deltaproteobacteria bacterium]|nr:hypothetical protein [Deltaproteobacteria bacterium]NIS76119.1 hypothetical protein [Deltaproteobacteria bacterium]
MKVEFYYSSAVDPAKQYFCDIPKTLELLEQLKGKEGFIVTVTDMKTFEGNIFRTYNASCTGPPAPKRGVFGTKGALEEDFGTTVPALLVFEKDDSRYPDEVFPRMDRELGRLMPCEEAAQNLVDR